MCHLLHAMYQFQGGRGHVWYAAAKAQHQQGELKHEKQQTPASGRPSIKELCMHLCLAFTAAQGLPHHPCQTVQACSCGS